LYVGSTDNVAVKIEKPSPTSPTGEASYGRVLLELGCTREALSAIEARAVAALLIVAATEVERT
jgi:hypothetical protein